METIRYRNTEILVKTIPKNTLLFRLPKNIEDDFKGVKLPDGTRCLTPNYNVYFHPNPFAGSIALEGFFKSSQQSVVAYRLTVVHRVASATDILRIPQNDYKMVAPYFQNSYEIF